MKPATFIITVIATTLMSATALAAVPEMQCQVKAPCSYSNSHDLGYCLQSSFHIRENTAVIGLENTDEFEIFRIAAEIPMEAQIAEGYRKYVGMSESGEDWIKLTPRGLSRTASIYEGTLAVAEDFAFEITCKVKAQPGRR